MHEGDVIGDTQTMSEGIVAATGLKVNVGVYEWDEGDPDDVRGEYSVYFRVRSRPIQPVPRFPDLR